MEEQSKKSDSALRANDVNTDENRTNTAKKFYIVIIVAVLLIAVVWFWKAIEIGNLKKENEKDRKAVINQAGRQIVQTHESHLKLLAKSYVWAVRAEMIQGNVRQVNLFANDMVKEKNFQTIAIANDKGIIISSTNKKDEGKPFNTVGSDSDLISLSTTVRNVSDSLLVMTSPIMGFNTRLGTLLIKYSIQKPDLK